MAWAAVWAATAVVTADTVAMAASAYATTGVDNSQPVASRYGSTSPGRDAANPPTSIGTDYVALGESDFRAGKYDQAIGAFRHALVDEPNNAGLMMLIAQSLFQAGKWTQAAAATELAMGALPEDKWGTVVQNYTQLYGDVGDYTSQLKALEAAVKGKAGRPGVAVPARISVRILELSAASRAELDKAVELEGRDPAARRLHDLFAAQTVRPGGRPGAGIETPGSANPATKASIPARRQQKRPGRKAQPAKVARSVKVFQSSEPRVNSGLAVFGKQSVPSESSPSSPSG